MGAGPAGGTHRRASLWLVVNDGAGEPRTVVYQKLNVMLLNEVKKQHRLIQDLTERLARMEKVLTVEHSLALTQ